MKITRKSPFSGEMNTMNINVNPNLLNAYENGEIPDLIQNIFPELTPDEREFIKTGITPEEWEDTFGPD